MLLVLIMAICKSFKSIILKSRILERLVQNSKGSYLLTDLSADNALNKRSGAIAKNSDIRKEAWVLRIESTPSTVFGNIHNEVDECKSG